MVNASVAYLTRRVTFSAMHSLQNPKLSDEENSRIFGKCFRLHGHDYQLEVTIKGVIDEKSGLCCPRDFFEDILTHDIRRVFHGKNLDLIFKSTTGENLVQEFFNYLKPRLEPLNLVQVGLRETSNNYFSTPSLSI